MTGSPPFAPFVSEFTILNAAIGEGRYIIGGLMLVLLLVIFMGMGATVLAVVQGQPSPRAKRTPFHDRAITILPPLVLMIGVVVLGLYVPAPLRRTIEEAVRFLGFPESQP